MQKHYTSEAWILKNLKQCVPIHPDPLLAKHGASSTFQERFWSKVKITETCWLWIGCLNECGYGSISTSSGRTMLANRASWLINRGDIPAGMKVLHTCDNPPCVNPDHLFIGTQADNIEDMVTKGRGAKGEVSGSHKLTEVQVLELRADRDSGMIIKQLRLKYNTSHANACAIIHRRTWTHI